MLPILLAGILGLSIGSFANVFLYRYPRGLSLVSPGSRCPHCGHALRWRHNVPVVSWIWLRGRCHDCGQPIAWTYPVVEAVFGLVPAALVWRFGSGPATWAYAVFFEALLLGAIADWQTQYLYDVITLPLAAMGLTMSLWFPGLLGGHWASALAMGLVAAGMLGLQALGRWMFGRESLGGGDVKLMAAAAGFLGWQGAYGALLAGSLLGLPLMLIHRRVHGGAWKDPVPFGPALALGCACAAYDLLNGSPILSSWLGLGPA